MEIGKGWASGFSGFKLCNLLLATNCRRGDSEDFIRAGGAPNDYIVSFKTSSLDGA